MKEEIKELYKFVLKNSRHHAFKTYSRPFLLKWIKDFCEEYNIEKPKGLDSRVELSQRPKEGAGHEQEK